MKKLLITLFILSNLSYSKIITDEQQKIEYTSEKIYDFSNIKNNNLLIIKSINNNIYFITKKYITNIRISKKQDSIYIEFFGGSTYGDYSIKSVEVNKDSYDTLINFLKEERVEQ